jgi:enoyl-CoA hydratase/carnithine racemase
MEIELSDNAAGLVVTQPAAGVWLLELNRPKVRNALSTALRNAVSNAIDVLVAGDDVRCIVVTGAGEFFCAGFDLKEFGAAWDDPRAGADLWASSDRFHHTVLRCPIPTIAALNGPALAGGFDLATLCDLRVAQPGVWFARPEVEWAVPLYEPLRDLVGGAFARELCLTGRRVELEEAVRIGLVNSIAPEGAAVAAALTLAGSIAARPSDAVRGVKGKFISALGLAARPTLAL